MEYNDLLKKWHTVIGGTFSGELSDDIQQYGQSRYEEGIKSAITLTELQKKYIDFLTAEMGKSASFLHAHNWNYSADSVNEGIALPRAF